MQEYCEHCGRKHKKHKLDMPHLPREGEVYINDGLYIDGKGYRYTLPDYSDIVVRHYDTGVYGIVHVHTRRCPMELDYEHIGYSTSLSECVSDIEHRYPDGVWINPERRKKQVALKERELS